MNIKRTLAVLAAGLMATVAADAAPWVNQRLPNTVLAKPGVTPDMRAEDSARCRAVVHNADDADLPQEDVPMSGAYGTSGAGGVAGVAGVVMANLILGLIAEGNAARRGESLCMYNLGYRAVPLKPEEVAAYTRLPPPKQKEWLRGFIPPDLEARFQPLLERRVPRLPGYDADAPMVQGGLKFSDLTLVATDIKQQGVVVKGHAARLRTATLVTPIETKTGPVRIAADAGTVFHQVDYRRQKDALLRRDGATWCGPMRQMAGGNIARDFYCFTGRDDGYEVYRPSGWPWFAGPYTAGLILPSYDQPIQLEARAEDDLPPLDFEIAVVAVDNYSLTVAASAVHDDKGVVLWVRRISYDKQGAAVLPLWDRKLVMTHGPDHAIKAELTSDGDGHDWRETGDLLPGLPVSPN